MTAKKMKILVQCDFDGTLTEEDISFSLLDAFAQGNWRQLLQEYREHKLPVGAFNTQAFAMIKADKATLLEAVKGEVKIRPGLQELVAYCSKRSYRLVIVSNGLDFYIKAILEDIGLQDLETHAAQTWFHPEGMKVKYIGPNGEQLDTGLKEAYTKLFLEQGYDIVYIGDGISDIYPARHAYQVLARGDLLDQCKKDKLKCKPFGDLIDVVKALEFL